MKAKMTIKGISSSIEIIETKAVRITESAHNAAKLHVAKGGARNILEYLSNLVILDPKRKK